MRIIILIVTSLLVNFTFGQNKIDSLLGQKGVFSKLTPKSISPNGIITFDLKLTISTTAKKGSKIKTTSILYLNTKDGIVGIDKSANTTTLLNAAKPNLLLYVETLTKQSFKYTSNKSEGKRVEKLNSNQISTYNNLPIKKMDASKATPQQYWNSSLTAIPYFVETKVFQKQFTRHLYGISYPDEGKFKSYLGSYGVGFYNFGDATFLCLSTEDNLLKIEIAKVEKIKVDFNTLGFIEKK